jgi:hypothetical protein
MILIIWFVCWPGLTSRDDPLDPHTLSQKQFADIRSKGEMRSFVMVITDGCSASASFGIVGRSSPAVSRWAAITPWSPAEC